MKRALIIFLILLIFTLLLPTVAVIKSDRSSRSEELATLFSEEATTDAAEG